MRAGRRLREAIKVEREYAEEEQGEASMALCPYFRGVGDRTCKSGCWTEPRCQMDMPIEGWPKPWVLGDARRRTHRRRY